MRRLTSSTAHVHELLPTPLTALVVATLALAWGSASAAFAAWLHAARGLRAPYTRKVFHFLIISVAAVVQLRWGLPGVVTYGSVIALIVLYTVFRGDGFAFYEAIARPSDAPRRSLFIIVPLLTTAVGGLLANLLFPAFAYVGYMAVAVGDAVGEPIGARWGRHRYAVPSIAGVRATRSIEGSAAVLVATALAVALLLVLTDVPTVRALSAALAIGAVTAAVEAISHHGLDNLTIQLAAAAAASFMSL